MPRTKSRPCPAGRHQLTPDTRACLACEGQEALAFISGFVITVEPSLDPVQVAEAIGSAARSVDQLRRLRIYLEADPTALTSGFSTAPNVVARLTHELVGRGAVVVVVAKCADCGRPRPLLNVVKEGRICNPCRRVRRAEVCSRCGDTKPVGGRAQGGAAVCANCWRRDPARAEPCKVCGEPGPVSVRDAAGLPTCVRCYRPPLRECGGCGRPGRIVSRLGGTALCVGCYTHPVHPCGRCGRVRPIARRARSGDPDLCAGCAQPVLATCMLCGTRRRCHFVAEGRPVCIPCSPVRAVACAHCGEVRAVTARWPEGPVCGRCYASALRRRGVCTSCSEQRRLVDPPGPGASRCATCAGLPKAHVCGRCGTEDKLYERGLCPRCVLTDRATDLLSGDGDIVPAALAPVYAAIVASPSATQALAWLRRGASASLLADLVQARTPLTHEVLDDLPATKAVAYLRQLLVASGALANRQERLAALERWLASALSATEIDGDRRLLRAYATWSVLARLRRRSRGDDISIEAAHRARQRFQAVLRFLCWLQRRGTTIGMCGQTEIDVWLSGGPCSAYEIRQFVVWAVHTRAMSGVEVPPKPWREGTGLDEDGRWAVARRLLHDDGIDVLDRVSGAFVLLFAQRVATVRMMTVADVMTAGGKVSVRFGQDPVELPDPLGELVARLCSERRGRSVGSPSTDWLFRGQLPGQPMSAGWLGQRLSRLGVSVRSSRRAALMQLAAELPSVVLADMLGLAPGTAVHWVRAAGGDWARYAAERARASS